MKRFALLAAWLALPLLVHAQSISPVLGAGVQYVFYNPSGLACAQTPPILIYASAAYVCTTGNVYAAIGGGSGGPYLPLAGGTMSGPITAPAATLGNAGITPCLNTQTGTTYTLASTDAGCVVTFNNSSAVTLTIPAGLGAQFSAVIEQLGTGVITPSPSGGVTFTTSAVTNGVGNTLTLFAPSANTFTMALGTTTPTIASAAVLAGSNGNAVAATANGIASLFSGSSGLSLAQFTYYSGGSANPAQTTAFAKALTPGSIIVVPLFMNQTTPCTPTDTAGNTYVDSGAGVVVQGGSSHAQIFVAYNTHATASNVVSCANGGAVYTQVSAYEILGSPSSSAVEAYVAVSNQTATNPSVSGLVLPGITTITPNDFVVAYVSTGGGNTSAGSGYTAPATFNYSGTEYGLKVSAGANAVTFANDDIDSISWAGIAVAIKPSSCLGVLNANGYCGYPTLTYLQNQIASDVTLGTSSYTPSANTFPAVTTAISGTWEVNASISLQTTSLATATNFTCQLYDGSTVFAQGYWSTPTIVSATVQDAQLALTGIISEASTATFTARCTSTSASQLMKAQAPNNSGGNFSSTINALRIQ